MTRANSLADLRKHSTGEWTVVDADAQRPPIALTATEAAALGMTGDAAPLEHDTNPLAAKFEHLWRMWDGPELTKEYRFHPHRKWRADYALIDAKVLIELEGGLYGNGRHNRAGGYLADIEKYNAASMLGFVVLRLGTGQVDHQHVTEIIDWLRKGMRA